MRQYEVKFHNGSTEFIHANNIWQAINRCYLWRDDVEKIRPIFNNGGAGLWRKV